MHLSKLFFPAILLFSITAAAQQTSTPSSPDSADDGPVKIRTDLIQIDALITDRSGKVVTGLRPDDIVVYQDGRPQKVIYVNFRPAQRDPNGAPRSGNTVSRQPTVGDEPPPSGVRSRRGRLITFVVDDGNCLATPAGTARIREAIRRFVDERMLPDDRVAIYRTLGGTALLQFYTSDREILRRKVDDISLIAPGNCGSTFEAYRDKSTFKVRSRGTETFESEADKAFRAQNEALDRENRALGTIGVLRHIVDELRQSPDRKAVFLFSEGIGGAINSRSGDALRDLVDRAARASVVINTVSAKGETLPGMLEAQDEVLPGIFRGRDRTEDAKRARIDEENELTLGLGYLAQATGGRIVRNQNFLEVPVTAILDSESGYYVVAYQPDEDTFRGKAFHRIEVRAVRNDLIVVARTGFGAATPDASASQAANGFLRALNSSFAAGDILVSVTPVIASSGNVVRAVVYIRGSDLTFSAAGAGSEMSLLSLTVAGVARDDSGKTVGQFHQLYPIRVSAEVAGAIARAGLEFVTDVPVKRPGLYSLRVAVGDNASKRFGADGGLADVPDTAKDEMVVTGLITTSADAAGKPVLLQARPLNGAIAPIVTESAASLRRYRSGSVLAYSYSVYNAGRRSSPAGLTKILRLYRDGVLVTESAEDPLEGRVDTEHRRIDDEGLLLIGPQLEAGEYQLQVVVTDHASKRTTKAWIDIEIVK